jgi:hypothetical protein
MRYDSRIVKVYIDDVLHCTIPESGVEGLLIALKEKGITNVTIR